MLSKIATSFYDESGSPKFFPIIGVNKMADEARKTDKTSKTGKVKKKRLSKGQRKHVRRLKQEARKASTTPS
jgi:hypothetical protein